MSEAPTGSKVWRGMKGKGKIYRYSLGMSSFESFDILMVKGRIDSGSDGLSIPIRIKNAKMTARKLVESRLRVVY